MSFFKTTREEAPPTDLSHVVFNFQDAESERPNETDVWFLEDAVRGTQIFGGIGASKSSGSGRQLALSFLKRGYSGIVTCGKVDEARIWKEYAREAGRLHDVLVFEPGGPYTFNPLQVELNRARDTGGGYADNIVSLFLSIIKMGNRLDGSGEGLGNEPFWVLAMQRMLKAAVDLPRLAKLGKEVVGKASGKEFELTVNNIAKILRDLPLGTGHYRKFFKICPPTSYDQHTALQDWADNSYTIYCLSWAAAYIHHLESLAGDTQQHGGMADSKMLTELESEKRTFEALSSYFLSELPTLAEKTRSSILEHFFAFASPFRSGLLADYFAVGTSPEILPERTFEGKIVILNFPVKQYLQLGVIAQSIYRKLWQQAVERREETPGMRPVFMWMDESHYFVGKDDVMFQTTARSARACTVLITQNISNYYAALGEGSKVWVDSLLGNLATKIFHNNNDSVTNEWASETIGKDYRGNFSTGDSGITIGEEFQYQFLPKNFSVLRTGGNTNKGRVEAVLTVAGREWSNDKNFLKVSFQQKPR